MKKTLVLVVAITLSFVGYSQDKLEEGMLVVTQKMSSDNEQANAQLAMMGEVKATTYFKNGKSRVEVSSPMTGDVIVITDEASNKMITFSDNPMLGKKYMKGSIDDAQVDSTLVTVKKGDKIKTVMGYKCQQYFVSTELQGQKVEMELYVTDAINAYSQQTTSLGSKLEGFPMYMSLTMNQLGTNIFITSEVTEINKDAVDTAKFDMTILEGYEEMTQPEIKN